MNGYKIQTALMVWGIYTIFIMCLLAGIITVFGEEPIYTTFIEGVIWLFLTTLFGWFTWCVTEEEFDDE